MPWVNPGKYSAAVREAKENLAAAKHGFERTSAESLGLLRDALEKLPAWRGLIKNYAPPFTPARHEALGPDELLMARYRADGALVPARE